MVDTGFVEKVAREAGELLMGGFQNREDLQIDRKDDGVNNVVTDMDIASESLIRSRLEGSCDARFMGEESATEIDYSGLVWIVDPIDGTVNYARGIPIWSVSIALVEDGIPLLGVVYDPTRDEMYSASRGTGATCNGRPIGCSRVADLQRALLVTGFPYDIDQDPHGAIGSFSNVLRQGVAVRRLGSAALDLALVASGKFDGFWEVSLNPWDVAAGILLVREAGGVVDSYGPVDPGSQSVVTDRLLASNGAIHEELRNLVAP